MLTFFRRKNSPERIAAETLYTAILAQARRPVFYSDYAVPDSFDGRFDAVLLHAFLVMRRLGREDQEMRSLSQALYDVMFVDMDHAVRESGIGDLSVGKHVRRMMKAFNGRVAAYEKGIENPQAMKDALRRNLYGTVQGDIEPGILEAMAIYVGETARRIDSMAMIDLKNGVVPWATMPNRLERKSA